MPGRHLNLVWNLPVRAEAAEAAVVFCIVLVSVSWQPETAGCIQRLSSSWGCPGNYRSRHILKSQTKTQRLGEETKRNYVGYVSVWTWKNWLLVVEKHTLRFRSGEGHVLMKKNSFELCKSRCFKKKLRSPTNVPQALKPSRFRQSLGCMPSRPNSRCPTPRRPCCCQAIFWNTIGSLQ